MIKISYKEKKSVLSLGRNGYVWTNGLGIEKDYTGNKIEIIPINSREDLSSCFISVPTEHVQQLIEALEKLK